MLTMRAAEAEAASVQFKQEHAQETEQLLKAHRWGCKGMGIMPVQLFLLAELFARFVCTLSNPEHTSSWCWA